MLSLSFRNSPEELLTFYVFSASELLAYDIILISRQRFEQEMCPLNGTCPCPPNAGCDCNEEVAYRSPLRDLHFLRVIIDEGHQFASGRKNNAYFALAKLRVERRWSVSGTPSSGLLGVEIGSTAYGVLVGSSTAHEQMLESRKKEPSFLQECKDLDSLRIMITGFLDVKPWSNAKEEDPANWGQYITPFRDGRRKPSSLRNLLNSVFVRHRIEDVEADVQLPPLHNRVVYLEPSWQDKLSQNTFIIQIISNAVTSERVEEDYMFHPKNRPSLHVLVNNLRQSGFYWTGITAEAISKTLHVSRQYLEKQALSKSVPHPDDVILKQAITAGEFILASPSWNALSELHEMGMYVDNLPSELRNFWSIVTGEERNPTLFGLSQLCKAQKFIDTHLYEDKHLLGSLKNMGRITMDKAWKELHRNGDAESMQESPVKGLKTLDNGKIQHRRNIHRTTAGQPKLTELFTVSKARATASLSKNKVHKKGMPTSLSTSEYHRESLKSALKPSKPVVLLDENSELSHTTLRGTASAKLSYLLDEITILQEDEKVLIFYEGDHIAYYIAQAFDLADVRYLIYSNSLDLALKSAYIATFNAKPTFRVMLMDMREAAHGLHIASASRVFFVNPVWQPNIEAQAIKRAHRVGQTRPVFVETLVLKDTLEDQMLKRRKGMTPREHQKAERSLLDDEPMRAIIEAVHILPFPPMQASRIEDQVAELKTPIRLFGRASNQDVDLENPYADLIFPIETKKTNKFSNKRNMTREASVHQPELDSPDRRKRKLTDDNDPEIGDGVSMQPSSSASDLDLAHQTGEPRPVKKRVGFILDSDSEPSSASQICHELANIGEVGPSSASTKSTPKKRVGFDLSNEDAESIFGR